jgi:thiamine phosphate synthase YjbQ (UPF0047 family)
MNFLSLWSMPCTLPLRSLSTMMNLACTMIMKVWLEKLAPHEPVSGYRHNVGEDNADAHMKRQIMGREVVVAVTRESSILEPGNGSSMGSLTEDVRKRVLVKIIGE